MIWEGNYISDILLSASKPNYFNGFAKRPFRTKGKGRNPLAALSCLFSKTWVILENEESGVNEWPFRIH
jgi:hypothetical protein